MGSEQSFHIGPTIKIKRIFQDVPKTKKECPNHPHKKEGKFCLECGTPIATIDYIGSESCGYQHFMDHLDEDIDIFFNVPTDGMEGVSRKYDILVENTKRSSIKNAPKAIKSKIFSELNSDQIEKEMKWFKEYYGEWIERFENTFGKENVEVMYATFSYWW